MAELSERLEKTREGLDEEKKKKLQKWKKDLIDTVEHEGEEMVAQKIKNGHILQLVEDEFFAQVMSFAQKSITESYLETNRERIKKEIPSSTDDSFNLEQYEGLNKTELAREMARHSIKGKNIVPVDKGDRYAHHKETRFFQYDRDSGVYRKKALQDLKNLANKMAKSKYSSHLEREYLKQMKSNPVRMHIDDMGLPENKILVNNRKILDISNPEDPEVSTVGHDSYALFRLNVNYDPNAVCPEFKKFIWNLLDDDKESIKTVQEFMGWLLKYPNRDYQKALLILGESDTGKSQLTEIIELMFSNASVSNLSFKMIGMERSFHLSKLQDSIINIDRDLASQTIEAPDYVKQAISQEKMNVEDKGSSSYKIRPKAKHIICSNVSPRIENTDDDGFYNRFITVIAPNVIDEDDKVKGFGEKLFEKESSGILNWMLEGLARLEENGRFTLNRKPYQNKNLWNQYGNSTQKFIWYQCDATGNDEDFVSFERLYEYYETWISSKLEERMSEYQFKETLREQPLFVETKRYEDGVQKRGVGGIKVPDFDE